MKKIIKSFISFTRIERIGLVALCALLLILIVVRATMSLWVQPQQVDAENQRRLTEAWQSFKRTHPQRETTDDAGEEKNYGNKFYKGDAPLPDTIDLNTADSATLVRLKGIGPATAHRILVRRRDKGPFIDVEQLKETGRFNDALFEMLKKHLCIKQP